MNVIKCRFMQEQSAKQTVRLESIPAERSRNKIDVIALNRPYGICGTRDYCGSGSLEHWQIGLGMDCPLHHSEEPRC